MFHWIILFLAICGSKNVYVFRQINNVASKFPSLRMRKAN